MKKAKRHEARTIARIPKDELDYYAAILKSSIFHQLITTFLRKQKEEGLTRTTIARRLGVSPSLITRRLDGDANMTLETLSHLAHAMNCRIETNLTDLSATTAARRRRRPRPGRIETSRRPAALAQPISEKGRSS